MGKSPRREDTASAHNPSFEEELSQDEDSSTHPSRRPQARSRSPRAVEPRKKNLSSVQLSDSLDEESSALEAEFSQFKANDEEAFDEGLGALDPELDELREPNVAKKPSEYDDNITRFAVLAKLAIIEGPDAKKDVPFIGIRMSLGRAPNLEISLTDVAVSRRHAEFVRGDEGVLLRDLGSGNGTLVNGQPVTEQILSHNDVITVGTTKLRYIDAAAARDKPELTSIKSTTVKPAPVKAEPTPSESTPLAPEKPDSQLALRKQKASTDEEEIEKALAQQEPQSSPARREKRALLRKKENSWQALPPEKKRLILIAAGAGALLCLLLVVFLRGGEQKPTTRVVEKPPPVSADSYMSQAREAVRLGNYEQALAFLAQAKAVNPEIDASNFGAQIELEIDVQKRFREIEALISRKEFSQAKITLDKTPDASARSNEEKKKLFERIVKDEQQFFQERAEELLMLGDFDAAMDALRLVPRARQAALGEKIEAGRASYNEALRLDREAKARASVSVAVSKAEARKRQIAAAFAEVQRKLNGEDWKRAADECDRVMAEHPSDAEIRKRAQELKKQIPDFGRAYDEGAQKYRAGQLAASAVPLAKARTLYSKMGLQAAAVESSLRDMLSQAALLAGEDTLARGDYAAAAGHFNKALELQPSSERAKRGLARVVEKAEDLFARGYSLRASDPREARHYFELIIKITPAGSHWSERSKNQLNSMAPP